MRRVTSTEAARQFSDLLNRARYQGECFIITRNGEDIGCLSPVRAPFTLKEFFDLARTRRVGGGFADDLEEVQSQQSLPEDPWAS